MTIEISNRTEMVSNVETAKAELQSQLSKLEEQRRQVSGQLKAMSSLLNTLTNGAANTTADRKPAPKRDDVVEIVAGILAERGSCHVEVLQEDVAAQVSKAGLSHVGLALRFRESLQSSRFTNEDDDIRLADQTADKPAD